LNAVLAVSLALDAGAIALRVFPKECHEPSAMAGLCDAAMPAP
jgi:hypothetical protein